MQRSRAKAHKGRLVTSLRECVRCTDKKHFLTVTDVKIELQQRGDELWTIGYNLSQPAESLQSFRIAIHQCTLNDDGCEYWNTWAWDSGICSLLHLNHTVWTPIVQSITPKVSCPMPAGHYTTVNGTLDLDGLLATVRGGGLVVERHSWRVEVQLYNELRQLYICFKCLGKFLRIKSRT